MTSRATWSIVIGGLVLLMFGLIWRARTAAVPAPHFPTPIRDARKLESPGPAAPKVPEDWVKPAIDGTLEIQGRVIERGTSKPLGGAQVTLEVLKDASKVVDFAQQRLQNSRLDSTQTAENGEFRFKLSGQGPAPLSKDIGRVSARRSGFAPTEAIFTLDRIPRPLTLSLSGGGKIEGRVLDSAFSGRPNVTVRFAPRNTEDVMRLLGTPLGAVASRWEAPLAQSVTLKTDVAGHYEVSYLQEGTWWGQASDDSGMAVDCPITNVVFGQTQVVNFLLPTQLLTLHGRIIDRSRNPIKNEMVLAVEGQVPPGVDLDLSKLTFKTATANTMTSETGSFVLEGIPFRTVRLSLPRSHRYRLPPQFLELTPGDTREILLVAEERLRIQGHVVDELTNKPVSVGGSDLLTVHAYDYRKKTRLGACDVEEDGSFSIWLDSEVPVTLKAILHSRKETYESATIGPVVPGTTDLVIPLHRKQE